MVDTIESVITSALIGPTSGALARKLAAYAAQAVLTHVRAIQQADMASGLQTLQTKYFGAGNVRGPRIVVTTSGGFRRHFSYSHEYNDADLHRHCASVVAADLKLLEKYYLIQGTNGKDGYVFVLASKIR